MTVRVFLHDIALFVSFRDRGIRVRMHVQRLDDCHGYPERLDLTQAPWREDRAAVLMQSGGQNRP